MWPGLAMILALCLRFFDETLSPIDVEFDVTMQQFLDCARYVHRLCTPVPFGHLLSFTHHDFVSLITTVV